MLSLSNPEWISKYEFPYTNFSQIPESVFTEINKNLNIRASKQPQVSILIAAWNEEINILRSVASLAEMETEIPFEIIVINNNSIDNTQLTIDKLQVKSLFQQKQGTGPARQLGQENALGKYILLADADCFYPKKWLDEMISILKKPAVSVVYGRYAFISEPGYPRWKLMILETLKNIFAEIRHLNKPFFNTYGLSMGYVKEYGLKVGFPMNNLRLDDGSLTLDLMKFGKIKQVRSSKATVWTGPRTLQKDGTLFQALKNRFTKEFKRFFSYFSKEIKSMPPKD